MTTEKLKEKLELPRRSAWRQMGATEKERMFSLADEYRHFLDLSKTEREAFSQILLQAKEEGFTPIGEGTGDVYWQQFGKMIALVKPGKLPVREGVNLVATHIDAPRIDLKLRPLFEEEGMAWFKTHYYGGIKKYQWVTIPLALHGVIFRKDGGKLTISIGEAEDDPVFTITDLLPHLAGKVQSSKRIADAIPAEKLNVLVGGLELDGDEKTKAGTKLAILDLLNRKYDLIEEDFIRAELELVPAGKARDVGFDRAFVGGYAHDDRACTFAALKALMETTNPARTAVLLCLDKEETGSDGNSGAKSKLIELLFSQLLSQNNEPADYASLLEAMRNSMAISADVTAGIDPSYSSVHDKYNDAKIGHGVCLTKYTGARGKSAANDAHAEYVAGITAEWSRKGLHWQAGEMGKVDVGGGGTVAKYLSALGMQVVDAGPPILSMHSPFEIIHKADLAMAKEAYLAHFEAKWS